MKLKIEIDLNNDSMIDSNYDEISMIFLIHSLDIIEECKKKRNKPIFKDYYHNIKDVNGNSIGQWTLKNK